MGQWSPCCGKVRSRRDASRPRCCTSGCVPLSSDIKWPCFNIVSVRLSLDDGWDMLRQVHGEALEFASQELRSAMVSSCIRKVHVFMATYANLNSDQWEARRSPLLRLLKFPFALFRVTGGYLIWGCCGSCHSDECLDRHRSRNM